MKSVLARQERHKHASVFDAAIPADEIGSEVIEASMTCSMYLPNAGATSGSSSTLSIGVCSARRRGPTGAPWISHGTGSWDRFRGDRTGGQGGERARRSAHRPDMARQRAVAAWQLIGAAR